MKVCEFTNLQEMGLSNCTTYVASPSVKKSPASFERLFVNFLNSADDLIDRHKNLTKRYAKSKQYRNNILTDNANISVNFSLFFSFIASIVIRKLFSKTWLIIELYCEIDPSYKNNWEGTKWNTNERNDTDRCNQIFKG